MIQAFLFLFAVQSCKTSAIGYKHKFLGGGLILDCDDRCKLVKVLWVLVKKKKGIQIMHCNDMFKKYGL